MAQRGGAGSEADNGESATGVLKYLASVLHSVQPQSSMSLRNSGRLRTIAERVEALHAGDFPHLEDLLVQRLKAVQTAVIEGNWNLARHLELTPAAGNNVVAQAGMRAAQRTQFDQRPLQQGGKKQMQQRCGQSKRVARSPQREISSTVASSCSAGGTPRLKC